MLKRTNTIICCIILFFLTGTCYPCLAAEDWHWRDGSSSDKPNKKFSGGNGTQNSPYLISSCQDMADLAYLIDNGNDFTGKYFRQTRDLVFNDSLIVDGRYNEKKDGTFKRYVSPGSCGLMDDEFEGIFDGGI